MSGETMVGFGPKQAWLAVREGNHEQVARALRLRDLGPVSWRDGIDLAYFTDDRVVLTPLLPGADQACWLLVTGRWLLRPDADVDPVGLSGRLATEVQYFATHRTPQWHRWERARHGSLVRAFGYVGETGEVTDWRGDPDPAERAFGLPAATTDETTVLVGEADVMRVAAAWSVDPSVLTGQPAPGPLRAAVCPSTG
ncbi:MAG TPA: hypothetical protein VF163_19320 [Micromonosporaceae bacterium]